MSDESERAYEELVAGLPPATKTRDRCGHENLAASCAIARLLDTGKFVADVRIVCMDCREPFRFVGLPPGLAFDHPMCSIDGLEAHLPIEPEVEKRLFSGASFHMPRIPSKH